MTRRLVLVFLAALSLSTTLFAETTRYMVVPRRATPAGALRMVANSEESRAHRVRRFEHAGSVAMDLTEAEAEELRRSGDVESVEPVVRVHALDTGSGPMPHLDFARAQTVPWGVTMVQASSVWPLTRGAGVNVVVIDSGIDTAHPDLAPMYSGGLNAFDTAKAPIDDHGHGTHVAGIISAADNAFGTIGVAPAAKLWAVKVLASDGGGSDENVAAAIDWVIGKKKELGGAWVANMSLGSQGGSAALARAVQRAVDADVILVAAAGNSGHGPLMYPAGYEGVISVGAIDAKREVASFSSYGNGLDVVAPGVDVTSTYMRGKYTAAEIDVQGVTLTGYSIINSPMAEVQGQYVNCGFGRPQDFPADLNGRICVIERSPPGEDAIPFSLKARNAKEAGSSAVIIYNDDDTKRNDFSRWMLQQDPEGPEYAFPLTIALSYADGSKLLNSGGGTIRMVYGYREYGLNTGTSMASPHVTGTVALLLSLAPHANFAQIEFVLETSTSEISTRGWDARSAWGMVDALSAARLLAPSAFGLPSTPPPPAKRRSSRS